MQSKSTFLITAGPTNEPIDEVRYIGNRSSGRVGLALAEAAVYMGHNVILLLGPINLCVDVTNGPYHCNSDGRSSNKSGNIDIYRFLTTEELEGLLNKFWPDCADILIMAAAVADYRPAKKTGSEENIPKIKRSTKGITLNLVPTPDLVTACRKRAKSTQKIVGFALEPKNILQSSATNKLKKKNLDAIVANPLETMDSQDIDATLIWSNGKIDKPGKLSKIKFAKWLIDKVISRF